MIGRMLCLLGALLAMAVSVTPVTASPASAVTGRPLVGALADRDAWRAYQARFVSEAGRVVDTGNGGISHSEGQGYGMVLAVAADDRGAFERIWGWTRANLMVRDDQLVAWRWEPGKRPAIADMNDASDGDLLIAWALMEAAEAWGDPAHRVAARRIAVELGRKLILPRSPYGPILLPAIAGFAAEDRPDGPVVNLSYWVFPAFERLPVVAPEFDWAGLSRNGLRLLERARFGASGLPVEWTALGGGEPRPADGFPAVFGYNAIRIPLYLAWAGLGGAEAQAPFTAIWARGRSPAVIDTRDGRATEPLSEAGYASVAALAGCASGAAARALPPLRIDTEHYYSVSLGLLSRIAAAQRYPQCLRG